MRSRFDEQLEKLNAELITMGALCEQAITIAINALVYGNDDDNRNSTKYTKPRGKSTRKNGISKISA